MELLHYLLHASNFVLNLLPEHHAVRVSTQLLRLNTHKHTRVRGTRAGEGCWSTYIVLELLNLSTESGKLAL